MLKENVMEISEIHLDNMVYPYISTVSSRLFNVSLWQ